MCVSVFLRSQTRLPDNCAHTLVRVRSPNARTESRSLSILHTISGSEYQNHRIVVLRMAGSVVRLAVGCWCTIVVGIRQLLFRSSVCGVNLCVCSGR